MTKFGAEGELQVKWTWYGVAAERFRVRVERSSPEHLRRWIGNALETRYSGSKLFGEPQLLDDREANRFTLTSRYKVPKLALDQERIWLVEFRPDNIRNVLVFSPTADRKTPLRIPEHPYDGKYTFEMTFPEEVSVVADPRADSFENNYFDLNTSLYFRGNFAKKTVEVTTKAYQVEPKHYPKFADDYDRALRAVGGTLYINKSALKSDDGGSQNLKLGQRLRGFHHEAVKKLTETIDGGKLQGRDLADAYCSRSQVLAELDRDEEALRDAAEAIKIVPSSPEMIACRGYATLHAGQLEKSIADYSKAISFGLIQSDAYRMRGIGRILAGRPADARVDFARAAELADKEAKLYCDIWLLIASRRGAIEILESTVTRTAAEATGEWPRPALAMLSGAISPERLLKILDEKKGDDGLMARAEGYFYLAEYYLSKGDEITARSYLEKARAIDVIIYTEHIAAGLELQRMRQAPSAERASAPVGPSTAQ